MDVTDAGGICIAHPNVEPWELADSCALDIAERGGMTLEEIGSIIGVSRERVRQIEEAALEILCRRKGRELRKLRKD
jgi:hypothetical protein